ncbi:MAG TPA: thiamine pyrophosphate-dependent enzyme, partial [Ktedonobacteraceae bacterium]|nr:thiamine pyrophosphate-dependent enzyme [Ktedonobacteraceae bacterium]
MVSGTLLRELYARMLQTRLVDECAWRLHTQGRIHFMARAYGHEAAQVGSAICIEKGTDFTLPYYRDLGVVLTIGMTPYEVFRSYLQTNETPTSSATHTTDQEQCHTNTSQHWGYHKHNIVTGPAPVATQILHAAGIAFAGKLRKAPVVTVAYCGDEATNEPDFHEGLRFAALHQLPAVFIYEHDCNQDERSQQAPIAGPSLPAGLAHQRIDGSDIIAVYTTMSTAMQRTREGNGPLLLEMCCPTNPSLNNDPLRCC